MSLAEDIRRTLTTWQAPSTEQDRLRHSYLRHLRQQPEALWRDGHHHHFTASCFVIDPGCRQTLLTLHRKGRFWVQLGGHLESADRSLVAAAHREAIEESGLISLRLPDPPIPWQLNRHGLAAAFGRCREHLDVAYLTVADPLTRTTTSTESLDVRWWPVNALPDNVAPDLPQRLASITTSCVSDRARRPSDRARDASEPGRRVRQS
ncbi:MAG: NUDIX hydrolase [Angustibacter sp.]